MHNYDPVLEELLADDNPNDKGPANGDLFSGLFLQDKKTKEQKKKPKNEEQVHEYLKLADRSSTKAKAQVKRIKEEQSMTPQQIRARRQIERATARFERAKKEAGSGNTGSGYMPKVIDPFGNSNKDSKSNSQPQTKSQKCMIASDKYRAQSRPTSKVEAKRDKIEEKEKERQAAAAEAKRKEKQQRLRAQKKKEQQREEQKRRERSRAKQQQAKKRKESSSSSSSSGSSSSGSDEQGEFDWRKQIRNLTGYNPQAKKYRVRDAQVIKESGFDRMTGEDRASLRYGLREQEEDWRREKAQRRRYMEKQAQHHR